MRKLLVKEYYHSSIIGDCIYELTRFFNMEEKPKVSDLVKVLRACSFIIADSEWQLIWSYNCDDLEGMSTSLTEMIFRFLDNQNDETFPYIQFSILNKNIKRIIDGAMYKEKNFIVTQENLINYFVKYYSKKRLFTAYYEIISDMIEDANNHPAWDEIRQYYREHRMPKNVKDIKRPITFLSYAFKDNVYAVFLSKLFVNSGGFLYVDSLFGEEHKKGDGKDDGDAIKKAIAPWIDRASQILFLHSLHSEGIKRGLSSWCSWELGYAYQSKKNKKFFRLMVFGIDEELSHPIIDKSFRKFVYIEDGIINKNISSRDQRKEDSKVNNFGYFDTKYLWE